MLVSFSQVRFGATFLGSMMSRDKKTINDILYPYF